MLSGNGRHRRPRQAPALLVAAGVTGSAIAIPLLGAASAHAADGTTWDKVAECESGGSWSANTGNGYYGGLSISQDDWDKYGGDQYADSADQASRSQQIAVAEKILADQGTTPWATCALLSGLTSNSGSVDVDPGVGGSGDTGGSGDATGSAGTPTPSGGSDSSDVPDSSPSESGSGSKGGSEDGSGKGSDTGSHEGSGSADGPGATPGSPSHGKGGATDSGAGAGAKGAGTLGSDKSASPDSGGMRGDDSSPTAEPDIDNSDNYRQSAGSWSLVDTGALGSGGRHRGANADENVTKSQGGIASGRHASREPGTYTVREGDSLVSIADSLEVDGGWRALYADNKKALGGDPNHISAGQTLEVAVETGQK
ncbi:transglycosylase family protein [Streptomyces sp. NPDC040750]|uniref:transglycosylase family protein n=1 Tax=Streptomyces sp. NPDC040750 TaxID=3154491 RepID=UPI0033ECBDD4